MDENGAALEGAEFTLEKKLADGTTKAIALDEATSNTSTFTFKGLDDGDYILTETKIPMGMKAIDPIEFTVTADHGVEWTDAEKREDVLTTLNGDVTTGELTMEADEATGSLTGDIENEEAKKPEFEKKIKDTNDTTGETSKWQDSADYDIGDAVPYRLTAKLADNVSDYQKYHITFHDTMEKGLTFNGITGVTVNGTEVTDYELKSEDHSFDLTLTWTGEEGKRIADASLNEAEVDVLFTATLNSDATVGSHGNVNEGSLEYSCNPNVDSEGKPKPNEDTEETEKDFVICFTYKVELNKVDPYGNALTGAEFTLEKKLADGTTKAIALDEDESGETNFVFKGLDDGEYILTETVVPEGYAGIDPITFKVTADHEVEWTDADARDDVLTRITGDVTTGELEFTADEGAGCLTADVENGMTYVAAAVRKLWDDDRNRDNARPLTVTVSLMQKAADGTVTAARDGHGTEIIRTLSLSNGWMAQVTGLPVMDADQEKIEYYWVEAEPGNGYTASYRTETVKNAEGVTVGIVTTITNTRIPEKTSVSVRKIWEDEGNAYQTRPAGIRVQLYADGAATGEEVILNAANGWSYTWTGLDKCENENENSLPGNPKTIKYTVEELEIPEGYQAKITGSATTGFVITNVLERGSLVIEKEFEFEPVIPEEPDNTPIDIPVIKTWNDNGNKDGNRPKSVTVRLWADGVETASAELTEADGWKFTFTGLAPYNGEEKIIYTVTEDPVEWYTAEINGFNIRNNYKPEVTSVSVRKVWNDNNNAAKLRPTSIYARLSNGTVVLLNEENNWTATVDNLPVKINGEPVVYTWTEQTVVGYNLTGVVQEGSTTVFTNTVVNVPQTPTGNKTPATPGGDWATFEEYETALGIELIINHVGDCFD
uniref:Collagen adhesin n=1 Tax=uncultured bacterium Contigcl_24 TaxID=1393668 RepID=W0FRH8_9BACT|nr:collagen adhesin [uncultured bacterium Contigcl_24]